MNLDDLADFVLVASNGGFSQASRHSGRPKASLSRKVMALESALGVRLFERGARVIRMTEEGAMLYEQATGPLNEITETADKLRNGRMKPHGRLRINTPPLFGRLSMGTLAAKFALTHPDINLSVTTEDRAVDLVGEGYDIVLRFNPDPQSDLVGRCIFRDELLIVSAPSIWDQFHKPGSAEKILPFVFRTSKKKYFLLQTVELENIKIRTQPILELSTLDMVRDALLTGIGAAKLPRLLVEEDLASGSLINWGPSSDKPPELWVLHASRRFTSAKVNAFIRFLENELPQN